MKIRAILLAAAMGVTLSTQVAHAYIAPWQLLESDFFRWSDWRENLAIYDCTSKMWYFMDNAPTDVASTPDVVVTEPPAYPPDPVPPYVPPYTPQPPAAAIPEVSTWLMVVMGFLGTVYATKRRSKCPQSL